MLKLFIRKYAVKLMGIVFLRVFDLIYLIIQIVIVSGYLAFVFITKGRKGLESLASREVAEYLNCPNNGNPRQ